MSVRAPLAVFLVLALATLLHGQGMPQPMVPRVIQFTPIELSGTVAAVQPGVILVKTPADELWGLRVTERAEIRVIGKAERDVLCPGLYVRFVATVDKQRSRVLDTVSKLTIITPSQEVGRQPGVFYPGQEEGMGEQPNPVFQPPGGVPGAEPPGNAEAKNEELFDIRAQVTGVRGNRVSLYVPNAFFKPVLMIELADDLEISLDLNNYGIAGPGDKLLSMGRQIAPQAVEALKVSIELAEPYSTKRKRPGPAVAGHTPPPPAGGNERQPFEVADRMDNQEPPEGGDPPPPDDPPPVPAVPIAGGDRTQQMAQLLAGQPGELQGVPPLNISLGGGDPESYAPAKAHPMKDIRQHFGSPERVMPLNGTLAVGGGGEAKDIQWWLIVYGPVKLLVDEDWKTRYFTVENR
ncbi:MAG TPA: hypothetical protein VMY42_16435 [Thermoguttaceae bacterium]|nr:hypothetical protein [Thermoguttaceae bacterium]